ncbi:hypothetical protein OV079_50380 [Nannocystis pusilla]|uniref:Uncharacterized protein n=1 Tax=Nannocystis pusilla TaxID=889268 RepID=A0A9X3F1I0_9BACT|nr:hypothetical protein [Nannocystis pusilla]MCY1013605.1 hypothetical protein [Nannocystis pusilla]
MVFTLLICSQAEAGWIKDRINDVKRIVHDVPKAVLPVQPGHRCCAQEEGPGRGGEGTVIDTTRTLTNSADQAFGQLAQATGGDFGRIVGLVDPRASPSDPASHE